MARNRLPQKLAEAKGAALKNAGRFKGRKVARTRDIGEPYKFMTPGEADAWREFAEELPWLNSSHRALLQLACRFRARLNSGDDVGITAISAYSSILSKLAATPVDETKAHHESADADSDPFDEFSN